MNLDEMLRLARQLAQAPGPDAAPMFKDLLDPCPASVPGSYHPNACICAGTGRVPTLDLNRWLIAIGTGAEFHLLPNDQWLCLIPQTTSRSMYQATPIAALLEAVDNAVKGL
ncbi:MAG: hypothetical protein HYU30_01400 [Chloroflexi bacterium]|nr:hypothetical protein [Chloroflexota bacterium]